MPHAICALATTPRQDLEQSLHQSCFCLIGRAGLLDQYPAQRAPSLSVLPYQQADVCYREVPAQRKLAKRSPSFCKVKSTGTMMNS